MATAMSNLNPTLQHYLDIKMNVLSWLRLFRSISFALCLFSTCSAYSQDRDSLILKFKVDVTNQPLLFRATGPLQEVAVDVKASDGILTIQSSPNTLWRFRDPQDTNKILARYFVATASPVDPISLSELFAAQAPRTFTVKNTTKQVVDVLWINQNQIEQNIVTLKPGESAPLENTYVGDKWSFRARGEVIATYVVKTTDSTKIPNQIDLNTLSAKYRRLATVYFDVQTKSGIDIIRIAPKSNVPLFRNVSSGTIVSVTALPNAKFEIFSAGTDQSLGTYVVTKDKRQTVPISGDVPK